MTDTSLLTKYRPQTFKGVIGQDKITASLAAAVKARSSHAFLLTGPSGTGKTTLARIAAADLGCQPLDLLEIDAATYTGIDDMRSVAAALSYQPLGGGAIKAVIIDEAHALSKQAITSLLKIVEDPPAWVYWFFCTTEAGKIPAAIKTRCVAYELKPVSVTVLTDLLLGIADEEKLSTPDEVIELCAREAGGSPRQAIAHLTACIPARNKAEAAELLRSAIESEQVINLARALYNGARWPELQGIIRDLGEVNAESVRQVIRAYGTKVALGSNGAAAQSALAVLDAFSTPFYGSDGLTPVVLACGRLALGGKS